MDLNNQKIEDHILILRKVLENGNTLKVYLRFHKIGENSSRHFSITGEEISPRGRFEAGGCFHGKVGEAFPELVPYFKWHLCSEDGPMHYVANTLYWVEQNKLDSARKCAIWPEATVEELRSPNLEGMLNDRLPGLLIEFREAMESLGFIW